jgi:hypothetical protein
MVLSALWLATGAMHHALTQADERDLCCLELDSRNFKTALALFRPQNASKKNLHRERAPVGSGFLLGLLGRALRFFHVGSQGSYGYQHFG